MDRPIETTMLTKMVWGPAIIGSVASLLANRKYSWCAGRGYTKVYRDMWRYIIQRNSYGQEFSSLADSLLFQQVFSSRLGTRQNCRAPSGHCSIIALQYLLQSP